MRRSQLLAALARLMLAIFLVGPVAADEPPRGPTIDDSLFEGLTPAAKASKPGPATPSIPSAGEDIDLGGLKDPFARVAGKMQRSQQALKAGDSQEETQDLQKEILTDLDALLKSLEKKCAGGNCNKPGNSSSSSSSSAGQKPSQKPASDSTARVGKPGDTTTEDAGAVDGMRDVWGHLPPKLREAMQNSSIEEFLPKYDELIKEFYRRVAEQPARGG